MVMRKWLRIMNKIIIDGENFDVNVDDCIEVNVTRKNKFLNVKNVNIKIKDDTELVLESISSFFKLDICINVLKGVKAKIYELKSGGECKYQYRYYLDKDSDISIWKVNDALSVQENILVNLNGENAKIDFNLKTVCKNKEKYNIMVYHNAKKTISNIINNGVNILDGSLEFNVSTFIPEGIIKCDASQSGRIINETNNECTIKPNLFIDENDVVANHSALIGTFSEDEIFYLMSRGIGKKEAQSLLTQGFLLKKMDYYKKEILNIINKYWR